MQIVPIERLLITAPELDGSKGLNRDQPNPSEPVVNTDVEAINLFLERHAHTPTTKRNYTKEIERLILWSVNIKQKPFSSLSFLEMREFFDFIGDPQPIDEWAAIRKHPRESSEWRPFVKVAIKPALKPGETDTGYKIRCQAHIKKHGDQFKAGVASSSKLTSMAIISSCCAWLVDYGYLRKNPMRQNKSERKVIRAEEASTGSLNSADGKVERFLDEDEWAAFQDAIELMAKETNVEKDAYERACFIAALMFYLAPRASELASSRMNSFRKLSGKWWWHVIGKGSKVAEIPANDGMINAVIRYRTHLGLDSPLPLSDDETPLLRSIKDGHAITTRQLNRILDELFKVASALLIKRAEEQTSKQDRAEYVLKAKKILRASSHWGRHTSISFQIRSGLDKSLVQRNARHSDSRTTDKYIHEDKVYWHNETQKLKND
jgi:hypothetical protein